MLVNNYIGKNLKYLREQRGIEQSQIAKLLGKKSTSAISEWEKGIRVPNVGDLHDIADYFNISLDDFVKSDISRIADTCSINSSLYKYKYFPVSISAGSLENIDYVLEYDLVSISDKLLGKYARNKNIIILKVNGDSMNNIIPHGSYIIVDTSRKSVLDINDNDIIVFSENGSYSVKRFLNDPGNNRFLFKPDSTDGTFTPIEIKYENSENLKLIGKVVKYIVNLD